MKKSMKSKGLFPAPLRKTVKDRILNPLSFLLSALIDSKEKQPVRNWKFQRKVPVRFVINKAKKPGRGRPAKGYDQVTRTWSKAA